MSHSMSVLMPIVMVMLCITGILTPLFPSKKNKHRKQLLYLQSSDHLTPVNPHNSIYSIVDSILGALSLPDIGQLFPDNDPNWRGADSSIFMEEVAQITNTN
jgi:YgbB family